MGPLDEFIREIIATDQAQSVADVVARLEAVAARLEALASALEPGQVAGAAPVERRRPVEEIERRRAIFRPSIVRVLFVVSAIPKREPTDLTDFYLANAHLYRSIRAAFVLMEGEASVPTGDGFLEYFRDRGCWLVTLPGEARPERGRPSNKVRLEYMEFIGRVLADTRPQGLVTITPRVTRLVQDVIRGAGCSVSAHVQVKVAKDLWKPALASRLRGMLASGDDRVRTHGVTREATVAERRAVLAREVRLVLLQNGNRRMRVYQIAELVIRHGSLRDLSEVQSGIRQILKQQREAFDQNGAGIRLASPEQAPGLPT